MLVYSAPESFPVPSPLRHDRRVPILLAALLAAGACRPAPPAQPTNVVMVVVDTLRADALGVHGSPVPTPVMDGLARAGVRFETALAPAPETAPSQATLFTGQDPLRHGVTRNGRSLPENAETLAEVLQRRGFATAAFVSSFVLDTRFGWSQGFDVYDARFEWSGAKVTLERIPGTVGLWDGFQIDGGFDRDAVATTIAARDWLRSAPEPFFLVVHYFDPHDPYDPPAHAAAATAMAPIDLSHRSFLDYPPAEIERQVRAYLGEVQHVDHAIGELLVPLRTRGLQDRTLVVLTADHGEGLGQHGWMHHAVHLYREQVRVPLVFAMPGLPSGASIATPVALRAVAPTILDLLGIPVPDSYTGRSLAAEVRRGREPEVQPVFGYRARRTGSTFGTERWSVRTERMRYIRDADGTIELYDLDADPFELVDLAASEPGYVTEHAALLDEYLARKPALDDDLSLTPEAREALRALGYVE